MLRARRGVPDTLRHHENLERLDSIPGALYLITFGKEYALSRGQDIGLVVHQKHSIDIATRAEPSGYLSRRTSGMGRRVDILCSFLVFRTLTAPVNYRRRLRIETG